MPSNTTKQESRRKVFLENPYDLETVFESLSIASDHDKELIYMDRLLATLRLDPYIELTTLNYNILQDLGMLKTTEDIMKHGEN